MASLLACLISVGAAGPAAAAQGSWTGNNVSPIIHYTNTWYSSTVATPSAGYPPANATITNVAWNWKLLPQPSNLSVRLCAKRTTGDQCVDISGLPANGGPVTGLNGGIANTGYYFQFRVNSPSTQAIFDKPWPNGYNYVYVYWSTP